MANYPAYQNYMQQPMMPMMASQPRPQPYMVEQNYPVIKGRPVSSFEEARASMIDFDGSVFYFPDLANQKIYTKQINLDGTPSIKIYELVALPPQQPVQAADVIPDNLVTKAEFEQTVNSLLQQIDALKNSSQSINVMPSSTPVPAPAMAAEKGNGNEEFKF